MNRTIKFSVKLKRIIIVYRAGYMPPKLLKQGKCKR